MVDREGTLNPDGSRREPWPAARRTSHSGHMLPLLSYGEGVTLARRNIRDQAEGTPARPLEPEYREDTEEKTKLLQ